MNRPTQTVFLTGSHTPRICGIADYGILLTKYLAKQRIGTQIWTRETPHAAWDDAAVARLKNRLMSERPPLVHFQYEPGIWDNQPSSLFLPYWAQRSGASVVVTLHSLDGIRGLGRLSLLPVLLAADAITVCSERQYNGLRRIKRFADITTLVPVGSPIETAARRTNTAGGLTLVYFGFVWRGRNIEACLTALRAVTEKIPGAKLHIVGTVKDATYKDEMMVLARRLGVQNNVVWRENLPTEAISQLLADSDIAVLPYPTGVSTGRTTLMAALQHALPVITMGNAGHLSGDAGKISGKDGNISGFAHGENMLIAPTGDREQFHAHTVAVAANPELHDLLSRGAKHLHESRFTWDNIAAQIANLPPYRKVSGQ